MSIERSDVKFYKSATYSDATGSGGRRSNTQLSSGSSNQLFPVITTAERTAGSSKLRKVFAQIESVQNLPMIDSKVYIENPTPGGDRIYFFPGTKTNIKSELTGSERLYGCGYLNANAAAAATEIVVRVEDGATPIFVDGDLIRISNKSNIDDVTINTTDEFAVISGTPTVLGNLVTITLAAGLTYAYASSNTRVASIYQAGTIAPTFSDLLVSSSAGVYDSVNYPISLVSKATIDQTWTLTFTSPTQLTVVGDTLGSLGTFSIASDIAPTNAPYSAAYFRIPVTGISGTFAINDTISFKTQSQSIPLWFKRVVPAGTVTFTGNKFLFVVEGESE